MSKGDRAVAGHVRVPGRDRRRLRCSTVFLDAGGVIVLPRRDLVCRALESAGITCDKSEVPHAHYRAVRLLDRSATYGGQMDYMAALCGELGVPAGRMQDALGALAQFADRRQSNEILWSEPGPGAVQTIDALARAGFAVVVVTNSNGHAAENLSEAGICQTGPGRGAVVTGIIDSALVGAAKPDPAIFHVALKYAGVGPASAVHVGDMVTADVIGAHSAGIVAIHLDPERRCRASDHRHIRRLSGIWRHIEPDRD
jgi:putative hydrolase of the HAD superfamily